MANRPKVSVVMPVYNAGDYLRPAIKSILNQTFSDFEFIIIDDGSTDKSLKIIRSFEDSRIRIVSRPNKGLATTLNEGLSMAMGEFIARMDNDDISLPTRLQTEVDFLESNPDVGLVGSNYITIDAKGKKLGATDVFTQPDDLKIAMVTCNQFGHGSVMMRAEVFNNVSPYDPAIHIEDYDLFNRISHKYKIANITEPLYKYRRNFAGIIYSDIKKSTQVAAKIRDREFDYLLRNRRKYRIYSSFHPPAGHQRDYRRKKSLIFSNLAYLYASHGRHLQAIILQTIATGLTPRWRRNWRHLKYLLHRKANLSEWQYDGI